MTDPNNLSNPQPPGSSGAPGNDQGESRREFIKKLTYATPVLTTFLLDDTAFANDDDDKKGRARGRTSPKPKSKESEALPPPP
jgi:hypothetical protein